MILRRETTLQTGLWLALSASVAMAQQATVPFDM